MTLNFVLFAIRKIKQLFICFANCSKSKALWDCLKEFFKDTINLPSLTPQSAIFGFLETNQELFLILNYLLLLFKYHLYVSRCSKTISFTALNTYSGKIFPNMMKKRKDFSSKSGVKFRFISNHVITFSVGGVWVYFLALFVVFYCSSRHMIYFNTLNFKDFVQAEVYLGCLCSLR